MARKREGVFRLLLHSISQAQTRGVWCKLILFPVSFTLEKVENACFSMREISNFLDLLWSEEDEPGDGGGEH